MFELDLNTGNIGDDMCELIYRYHAVLTEIQRLGKVRCHQAMNAFGAVVDITEGARLFAIAPYLDLRLAGEFCNRDLAAESSGCFFTAAFPCSLFAKDVVKPHDSRLDAIVLAIMHT